MTDVDNHPPPDDRQSAAASKRATDRGPALLPDMEQFVSLVRKVRLTPLVRQWVKAVTPEQPVPEPQRLPKQPAVLPPAERAALFQTVATFADATRAELERGADLIMTLTDEYGALAVQSLLDGSEEAGLLERRVDAASRALYLYLRHTYPAPGRVPDARFLHADHVQSMNRSWRSEHYSSHFKGPQGVAPCVTEAALDALRVRILTFYPQLTAADIQIEHYTRRDLAHSHPEHASDAAAADQVVLHTITAVFNGGQAQFKQVQQGDVVDRVEPAAIDISYSWDPIEGLLCVYSEDRENRQAFATAFRDELLARAGEIEGMPLREFNLSAFLDESILERIQKERIPGVNQIAIQALKVAMIEEQSDVDRRNGRPIQRQIRSPLTIGRDKHDYREVYEVAQKVHRIPNLKSYDLQKVRMTMFMAARPHRGAHRVPVEITMPNGLSDRCKTEEDRRQVLAQLAQLGIMREF